MKNFDTIFFCLAGTVSFHDDFCMIVVKDLSVVRVGGDDGVEEEEEVDVGDSGSVDGEEEEEEDDDDSESGMNTDQHMAEFQFDFDVDDDSEDDLRNLFRSIEFHDAPPDPMTCSKSRLATVSYSGQLHTFVCLFITRYVCLSISRSAHISALIPFPL